MNGLLAFLDALQSIPVVLVHNHLEYVPHLKLRRSYAIGFFGSPHPVYHVLLQTKQLSEGRNHQGGFTIFDRSDDNAFCSVDDSHVSE